MKKLINGEHLTIDEAWAKHKGLCWKYVRCNMERAKRMSYTKADLIQTAAMAFTQAYNGFDENAGVKFSTYAVPVIFGVMDNAFSRNNAGLHYSEPVKSLAYRYLKGKSKEEREISQLDDIMNSLQIDYSRAYDVFQFIHNELLFSMDFPVTIENTTGSGEMVGSNHWDIIGQEADYSSIFINELKSHCTELENQVIDLIFIGVERRDMPEILGVKPTNIFSRVQRIKRRIREKGLLHDGQPPAITK
ncbi:RNA polymerase sigma factor [Bacillus phage Pavlov]|uniref:RNA polymerase sigma factor n=1 Tax=Bacillus phage Pavlov TaxID=1675598 RepID=UPI00065F336D|nr:RNA polymerase sigma factor [Bacillus phage Pavlov]AKQ07465.1 RNA polymerase sigma factor [Bacillus phage Pavlov]